MTQHFIIDTETLGILPNSIMLSLSCVSFDFESDTNDFNEYVKNGFNIKFDVMDQKILYKRTTDKSTMEWWRKQTPQAKTVLVAQPTDRTLKFGMAAFNIWLSKNNYSQTDSYLWARGLYFDLPLLLTAYDQVDIKHYFNIFKTRDTRTYFDIMCGTDTGKPYPVIEPPTEYIKHNSLHDAAFEAYCIKHVYKSAINDV